MKDILVNLSNDKSLQSRLRVSALLSNKFHAHVTGVYIRRFVTYEILSPHAKHNRFNDFDHEQQQFSSEAKLHLQQYADFFDKKVEFIDKIGDVSQELNYLSGAYDLVVTGQVGTEDQDDPGNVPADVVLGCGRPVLVVPVLPTDATVGNSVLVAWNGTRESSRALHDAMPILEMANYVNIVIFSAPNEAEDVVDISNLLTHHDVTHDILHVIAADEAIPEKISEFVGHFDSDILVMGAYGHSRLREFVLGGVTKSMLEITAIPLLISH